MSDDTKRMRELIDILDKAAKAYYVQGVEIMSNYEYDSLYDELEALEEKTGIQMSDSPTLKVGYDVVSEIPKERHAKRMLSLSKTKSVDELAEFVGDKKGLLSWKLDGLTIVLSYENGSLVKAVTRGNGEIGEIVTSNAKAFKNIPLSIEYKGNLVIRGEAVIFYSDFEKVNAEIPETDAKYKNPRNLCSGSVRQLDSNITKERNVRFFAFDLVEASDVDFKNSKDEELKWLKTQGFQVVDYYVVNKDNIRETIEKMEAAIPGNDFPTDGLVLLYDDIEYGKSLGTTIKYPRNAIAFKWKDETQETVLREIEWSASRTGLINPIAVFDSVELEGTSVSRASLHNISYIREFKLGIGDRIEVFKANMIIPQIAKNLTCSDNAQIPAVCPVCSGATVQKKDTDSVTLYCTNPECPAKHIKKFVHFASRDAMNIEGISEATFERFVQKKIITEPADIFHLDEHRDTIVNMDGFGEKSFEKMIESVNNAKDTDLYRILYGIGIPGIGLANAKAIARVLKTPEACANASKEDLMSIDGVGEVLADAFTDFFNNPQNIREYEDILKNVSLKENDNSNNSNVLEGLKFVITGSLNNFDNRSDLKNYIESLGGSTASSVSSNTDYLISNEKSSGSEKSKKAASLGVPVISEEEFMILVKQKNMM